MGSLRTETCVAASAAAWRCSRSLAALGPGASTGRRGRAHRQRRLVLGDLLQHGAAARRGQPQRPIAPATTSTTSPKRPTTRTWSAARFTGAARIPAVVRRVRRLGQRLRSTSCSCSLRCRPTPSTATGWWRPTPTARRLFPAGPDGFQTFVTFPGSTGALLPDGRGWEMVSPGRQKRRRGRSARRRSPTAASSRPRPAAARSPTAPPPPSAPAPWARPPPASTSPPAPGAAGRRRTSACPSSPAPTTPRPTASPTGSSTRPRPRPAAERQALPRRRHRLPGGEPAAARHRRPGRLPELLPARRRAASRPCSARATSPR